MSKTYAIRDASTISQTYMQQENLSVIDFMTSGNIPGHLSMNQIGSQERFQQEPVCAPRINVLTSAITLIIIILGFGFTGFETRRPLHFL
jgi:hypothetical protein